MSKSPAFQFYPKDWLSSLKISLMTPAEEGAYIRLLCYCWDDADCSIPDNDEILAKMSRLNEGWFKGGSTVVRKCFNQHPTKPGFLTNERLMKEREKQKKWSEKSHEGGKKSGEVRRIAASLKSQSKTKGGSQMVEPNGNIAFASSSADIKKIEDIKNISSTKEKKDVFELPLWISQKDWDEFLEHRKSIKAPMSLIAQKRLISKLTELKEQGEDISKVLNESIVNGWKGVFSIKNVQAGSFYGQRKESSAERYARVSAASRQRAEEEDRRRAQHMEKDITPFVNQNAQGFSDNEFDIFAEMDKSNNTRLV